MRKILVFQHVAHEILGILNPLLKARGFRVRYVNFDRQPDFKPSLDRYNGLIILGGHMGAYEADRYPHLRAEMAVIEQALQRDVPVLGICLGAQMLAQVLGAHVRKHTQLELGWCDLEMQPVALKDPLFQHFSGREKVFQLHGDTFDIPTSAEQLARSAICEGQIFRYGRKVYGLQCHLEVDQFMIRRWLKVPESMALLKASGGTVTAQQIEGESEQFMARSKWLSQHTFHRFLDLFGVQPRGELLGTDHAKPG